MPVSSPAKRFLVATVAALAVLYAADYTSVLYRIWKKQNPFDSVQIESYYAIREKSGKTEYIFQDPQNEICVRSLFPHLGHRPCWYARRKNEKRTDI